MRGGKREGSGRKAGVANVRTREIADKAHSEGITPLEVMLLTMRAAWAEAEKIDDPLGSLQLRTLAVETAHKAAPYVHPKLANVELNGKDGGPLTVKVVTCG